MSNPETVPAQRVVHGRAVPNAFARVKAMAAAIARANLLAGLARQLALDNIQSSWSPGKGKGKRARSAKKPARYSTNHYPFSSRRQDAQAAHTQRMVVVNGFELMQTIPARERGAQIVARSA